MSRNHPDDPPDGVEWCAHLVGPPKTGDEHKDYLWDLRALMFNAIRYSIYYTEGSGSAELASHQRDKEKEDDRAFWAQAMDHHNREHPYEVACVRAVMAGRPLPPAPQPRGQAPPQIKEQSGEEEEWRREEEEWRRRPEEEPE